MIVEVVLGSMSVVGMASGVAALVFYRKNGNGKQEPPPGPPPVTENPVERFLPVLQKLDQLPQELAAVLAQTMGGVLDRLHGLEHPPEPVWAIEMVRELEVIHDRMSEPATAMLPPELTVGLERVTNRLEALLQVPPPAPPDLEPVVARLEKLVASMPQPEPLAAELAELPHKLSEILAARLGRSAPPAAAKPAGGGTAPPKTGPPRAVPPMNPNELPATPSIPAAYVAGSVFVPAGSVWSLLLLIQKQLSPNCPGSSVEFSISADDKIFVGGASALGGPLTTTNYGYTLDQNEPPRIYHSTYPGGNTPVGELQVLSSGNGGTIHVEVQA